MILILIAVGAVYKFYFGISFFCVYDNVQGGNRYGKICNGVGCGNDK